MTNEHLRTAATGVLWACSLMLMVVGTIAAAPGAFVAWSLFLGLGASLATLWVIVDGLSRRDQIRVSERAQMMAQVAEEHY